MKKKWIMIVFLALCLFLAQPALNAFASGAVAVSSVDISDQQITLNPGEIWLLLASVEPENASNTSLNLSSSHYDVARVDDGGRVIAIKPGIATITAAARIQNQE